MAMESLRSIFAQDPTISEIIPLFLENLKGYVVSLDKALKAGERDTALRICHDLKGTAGGYGYPSISEEASSLESVLKTDEILSERMAQIFFKLRDLCQRAIETGA
jgi:HPt (histidine-containing phosphotransfer) domain-containing protein